MLGSPYGAQRASRRFRIRPAAGLLLTVVMLGSIVAAPSVAATSSGTVRIASTATLSTTTVDRPWISAEAFYLGLVNCTRTGGWVQRDGTCWGYNSGRYSGYVRPLIWSLGISDGVSRPYARLLAVTGQCSHYLDHDPGYRLRRAGYVHWTWGENIGCRDAYVSVKSAVLASHLAFQAEKYNGGGHWRNIKNSAYLYIGIGIWRYGYRTRLVTDFYR